MTDKARQRLAEKLRLAREERGLSQEEVAAKLGIPRPAVSQMERGHRRVEALELARLAKLYQRSLSFFAEEEPVGTSRLSLLQRATADLSEKDREEVLRFAEFLREKASKEKK